jgi:hypothetical protein
VERPLVAHLGGEGERLPARAGAGVDDRLAGARAAGERDELAPLVLDLEATLAKGAERERVLAPVEDEAPGRQAGGLRADPLPRSPARRFARAVRGARAFIAAARARASSTPSWAARRATIQRGSEASSASRSSGSATAAMRASAAASASRRAGATPRRRAASSGGTPRKRASHAA